MVGVSYQTWVFWENGLHMPRYPAMMEERVDRVFPMTTALDKDKK